jgi:predicted glutamine amidotransferase
MCGIVYAQSFNEKPVNTAVFKQFMAQHSRGWEGFGLFNGKHLVKAAEERRIVKWLKKDRNKSDMILFHHRMPTSTINVRRAAHPFTTGDHFGNVEYVLVHNGWVSNADKLWESHASMGIPYTSLLDDLTFNDSESLLWDFALTIEGKQDKQKAYGNIAFVCMKLVDGVPEKLYFNRNQPKPLNMHRDETGIMLSSEGPGKEIEADTLHTFNYALGRITKRHWKLWTYNPDTVYAPKYQRHAGNSYDNDNACAQPRNSGFSYPYSNDNGSDSAHYYLNNEEIEEDNEFQRLDALYGKHEVNTYQMPSAKDVITTSARYKTYLNFLPKDVKDNEGFTLLCAYLKEAEGAYDLAYQSMEADYDLWSESPQDQDRDDLLNAILEAVEIMYKDPLYAANKKVNELFVPEAKKQQMLLTA